MKKMIVTGASSGIGRALALRAAQNNFATVLIGRNAAALDEISKLIHDGGGLCTTLTMDITDPQAASAIVSTTVQRYGAIDIVVNNAGTAASGPLYEQSDQDVRLQFETHVLAALRLTRWALPELAKSKGQVFFFGSGVARVPTPNLGAYPAAKAAVRAMSTQLRREVRSMGVCVTYVDPGAVDTPFMQRAGMAGPPQRLMVSPHTVAKKILRAIKTRPHTVNAVRWQIAMLGLAELFPLLTDAVLAAFPSIVGTAPTCHPELVEEPPPEVALDCHPELVEGPPPFDIALAPLARRMERLKLPRAFIEQLLVPGDSLELGDVAMRWAGMPNKNERAVVAEVFEALTTSHYLQKTGDETWTVLRSSTDS